MGSWETFFQLPSGRTGLTVRARGLHPCQRCAVLGPETAGDPRRALLEGMLGPAPGFSPQEPVLGQKRDVDSAGWV